MDLAIAIEQEYSIENFKKRFRKVQQLIRFKPTMSQMNPNKINILSIDGGGFRNLIPLIILMELEIRSKRNIASMFNIIGGTSFGAIIAACLNMPSLLNPNKPKFLTKDIFVQWDRHLPKIFLNTEGISSKNLQYKLYMKMIRSKQQYLKPND